MNIVQFTSKKDPNIYSKIIADSANSFTGDRITTLELNYPRIAHRQFLTHRVFSRNSQSNRAITTHHIVNESPVYLPIHQGKEQKGMVAEEELYEDILLDNRSMDFKTAWAYCAMRQIESAHSFYVSGYHKQICNVLLEPFQYIKTIVTSTAYDNFFDLRIADDASPEIAEIANLMFHCIKESKPEYLSTDEWHLPYVDKEEPGSLNEKIKFSVARCARVSYLKQNQVNKFKDLRLYTRLLNNRHLSPFEHQATPITSHVHREGITAYHYKLGLMSNNFTGFIQYRAIVE